MYRAPLFCLKISRYGFWSISPPSALPPHENLGPVPQVCYDACTGFASSKQGSLLFIIMRTNDRNMFFFTLANPWNIASDLNGHISFSWSSHDIKVRWTIWRNIVNLVIWTHLLCISHTNGCINSNLKAHLWHLKLKESSWRLSRIMPCESSLFDLYTVLIWECRAFPEVWWAFLEETCLFLCRWNSMEI